MRRWLDPKWYGFLWQRHDRRGLAVVLLVLVAALAAGGYAAADSLKSSDSAVGIVRLEAVKHKVRVNGRERVVTQYVTLSTTDVAPPSTVVRTRVVNHPVVKVKTVQAAPVVRRHLVYVTRKGLTVTRSRTQTQTQTATQTETTVQTVTQPSTVVDSKTVTRRVTTTAPAQTVTVTGAVITVTQPAKTVTRTTTVTVTTKPPPPPPPTTTTKP